jgi:hypothetical protein
MSKLTPEQLKRIKEKHASIDEDYSAPKVIEQSAKVPEGWDTKKEQK